jgi:phosphopantetheinyl transferase
MSAATTPSAPSGKMQPQVWLCPLAGDLPSEPDPTLWLDVRERERYQRFRHPGAARRFLLARAMLKSQVAALEAVSPESIELVYSANGKPSLPGADRPFFSISHCATAVAVAFAPFDLGVDLEVVERPTRPWMRPGHFLPPDEAEQLNALPEDRRAQFFTHRWTCQEAAIKLLDSSVFNREARVRFGEDVSRGECAGRQLCFSSWEVRSETGQVSPFKYGSGDLVLSLAAVEPLSNTRVGRWGW